LNKTKLYSALISLTFSMSVAAMGLGELKVHSSLDQPFDAEIELIDVSDIPFPEIKAALASAEDYERVGIARSFGLNTLTFLIENNQAGKPVVHLRSVERISDPFIQLLVDLAWSKGQVYRRYDILLDPPDYQLIVKKITVATPKYHRYEYVEPKNSIEPSTSSDATITPESASDQWVKVSYGPVLPGETIWQVAQHYKTPGMSLPQLILAIVGTNQAAFSQDNLNGLKAGSKLIIPSAAMVGRVPLSDAQREVEAHELAWKTKQPIQHVLLPPYLTAPEEITQPLNVSSVPTVPVLHQTGVVRPMKTYLSAQQDAHPAIQPTSSRVEEIAPLMKAQMDMTAQAIESVRESNALLKDELRSQHLANQRLQKQLKQRDSDMLKMQAQIELLMRRQGVAGQVIPSAETAHQSHSTLLWLLLLLGMGAAGGYLAWRKWGFPEQFQLYEFPIFKKRLDVDKTSEQPINVQPPPPVNAPDKPVEPTEDMPVQPAGEDEAISTLKEEERIIEFIPEPLIAAQPDPNEANNENQAEQASNYDSAVDAGTHVIEFAPIDATKSTNAEDEKPVKSKAVLDTLLALAETYIDMGDIAAAKESLNEVMEFGNKRQQTAAKKLLKKL
jgi:pilus assembly protein FimV